MNFTKNKVKEILATAWDNCYNGSAKEDVVRQIINEYNITEAEDVIAPPPPKEGQERIYSVKELLSLPANTRFAHKDLGICWIESDVSGRKKLVFSDQSWGAASINNDGYPFDIPMKILYEEGAAA